MQNLVPCILVSFEKEQIVVWRGKDYSPAEAVKYSVDWELSDYLTNGLVRDKADQDNSDNNRADHEFISDDDEK